MAARGATRAQTEQGEISRKHNRSPEGMVIRSIAELGFCAFYLFGNEAFCPITYPIIKLIFAW
ncbi:MAG: hypothetical protein RL630_1472 [Verrucomicrobiota bacterium]|jgi:hypothetical protein